MNGLQEINRVLEAEDYRVKPFRQVIVALEACSHDHDDVFDRGCYNCSDRAECERQFEVLTGRVTHRTGKQRVKRR